MKTVHKIIDLCEELSDRRVNFGLTAYHFNGQSLMLSVNQWNESQSMITQNEIIGKTPDDMLELLELVKFHGFRGES